MNVIDQQESLSRDSVIQRIRAALKRRTGRTWSVTGGRGTAWGWIKVDAPPARATWRYRLKVGMPDRPENYEEYDSGHRDGHMSPADRADLAGRLGLDAIHFQGYSIPASTAHYREALQRAEGRPVTAIAEAYWD